MAAFRATTTTIVTVAALLAFYGSVPTHDDVDACTREAQLSAGSASPGTTSSAAGATGGTGALSGGSTLGDEASVPRETGLRGMQTGQADRGYQQVYRDCMAGRGYVP